MSGTVRAMAVLGPTHAARPDVVSLDFRGTPVLVGLTEVTPPRLDPANPDHRTAVLVRVRAFSTNYRDRWLMRKGALAVRGSACWVLGSEFAGEVVQTGPGVTRFSPGDRVMGDNHWTGEVRGEDGRNLRRGVPTNHSSREMLLLQEHQLHPVPVEMEWATAAAFSIGAQTAISMARKAASRAGNRVLVTAGRSSTSLFLVPALAALDVRITVVTSSERDTEVLRAGGVEVVVIWPREADDPPPALRRLAPFDAVVDPFYDVYAPRTLPVLRPGGTYVWCGLTDDQDTAGPSPSSRSAHAAAQALSIAMIRNLRLVGNCIGYSRDLSEGVRLWREGQFPVPLDSAFGPAEAVEFIDRTFVDPGRLGKTVLLYDTDT